MIREQPWHQRRATYWHHRWYRDLVDLHRLTLGWLRELNVDRPSHFLGPAVSAETREAVQNLERAADTALGSSQGAGVGTGGLLESILDDTAPEDLLGRIDYSVRTLQSWTLRSILEQCPPSDRSAWIGNLEQSSWKSGREAGTALWPDAPAPAFDDLRNVIDAFRESAFGSGPNHEDILVMRATRMEAWIDLRACPHRHTNAGHKETTDELCDLQSHWIRGFLYSLNSRIIVTSLPSPSAPDLPSGRHCALRLRIDG